MKIVVWTENAPRLVQKLAALPLPPDAQLVAATCAEEAMPHAADAEVLVAWGGGPAAAFPPAAPRLRLVQAIGAGVEGLMTPEFVASPVLLANARGCNAPNMAEHTLGLILTLSRNLHVAVRNQAKRLWDSTAARGGDIDGKTLGILGYGEIGRATAQRAKAFGMRIATASRPGKPASAEVDAVYPDAGALAEASDYLVVAVPLTPATHWIIGRAEIARMKRTACLINISRGATVDGDALADALREERIAGAALDVTVPEPLPPESPLWDLPNLLITPHVAGSSPRYIERYLALTAANISRLAAGEPLINQVDKARGY